MVPKLITKVIGEIFFKTGKPWLTDAYDFISGMITKFLNAVTFDGYNPYRQLKVVLTGKP